MWLVRKTLRFLASEDGPAAVEYAFMLALIVLFSFSALHALGTKSSATFTGVCTRLPTGE